MPAFHIGVHGCKTQLRLPASWQCRASQAAGDSWSNWSCHPSGRPGLSSWLQYWPWVCIWEVMGALSVSVCLSLEEEEEKEEEEEEEKRCQFHLFLHICVCNFLSSPSSTTSGKKKNLSQAWVSISTLLDSIQRKNSPFFFMHASTFNLRQYFPWPEIKDSLNWVC